MNPLNVQCTLRWAALSLAIGAWLPAGADDRIELEGMKVIGNRELPKVMHIVPWKKPLPGEMSERPMTSLFNEPLVPIDRDQFRRQLHFYALAQAQAAAPAAAPNPVAAPAATPAPAKDAGKPASK